MKKILLYLGILLLVVFILPSIFTKKRKINTESNNENVNQSKQEVQNEYKYTKYSSIKLYHSKTGEIEELPIDEYLYSVVSAEIPVSYNLEALKAQAVAARTYTLYQIIHSSGKHQEADICDDYACCQAWISKEDRLSKWEESEANDNWNKIKFAVDSTKGQIITYNNEPIDAFFHSNSGGITETANNVWGGSDFPYLQSVQTSGEDGYSEYDSYVELSRDELLEKLKKKYSNIQIDFKDKDSIKILEYTGSGRVRTIKFGNIEIAGTEARKIFGLKSTNFKVEITESLIKFSVIGYGHGVGMSQTGANSLADEGKNYQEILKHFYTGVEINYII